MGLILGIAAGVWLGLTLYHRPKAIAHLIEDLFWIAASVLAIGVVLALVALPIVLIYWAVTDGSIMKIAVLGLLALGAIGLTIHWCNVAAAHIKFWRKRKAVKAKKGKWLLKPILIQMLKQSPSSLFFIFATAMGPFALVKKFGFTTSEENMVIFYCLIAVAPLLVWPLAFHEARSEVVKKRKASRIVRAKSSAA